MCRNQYAMVYCRNCKPSRRVRYHVGLTHCSKSDGQTVCAVAFREMRNGPSSQMYCTKCHQFVAPPPATNNNQPIYEEVITGYPQLQTDSANAQSNSQLLLQQPYDVAMAEAAAAPPAEGTLYQYNDNSYQQAADQAAAQAAYQAAYASGQAYAYADNNNGEASGYNQNYSQGYSQDYSQYDQGHGSGHGQ